MKLYLNLLKNHIFSIRQYATKMAVPVNIELTDGIKMPILGFGTWQASDAELDNAMELALQAGYRHIDTAYVYENEPVIGRVLNRWLTGGKLRREDLFVVTKLGPGGNRPSTVEKYCKKSLANLQLKYLDQYLVHTPFTFKEVEDDNHPKDAEENLIIETDTDLVAIWKEMEKLVDTGLTRTIGVSNFNISQLQKILANCRIPPATLQIEVHLYFQQNELVEFCKKNHIAVVAYSPLGSRGLGQMLAANGDTTKILDLIDNPVVKEIAKKHSKTPAQILLRYTVQRGIAAIPKSTNPERLRQNISVFDFCLDEDDVAKLKAENKGPKARVCDFSFFKGLNRHPEFPF